MSDIFTQSPDHTLTDMKRSREVKVMTALTVGGGPAVFLHGKGLRLLLPAGEATRISREIIDHLAEAKGIAHTRYTTYSIEQENHAANSTE